METSDEKLRLNRSIVISYLILVDINTYREILFNFHIYIYIHLLNIRGFEYIFIIAISILYITYRFPIPLRDAQRIFK